MSADSDNNIVLRTVGLTKVFRDFWLREKVTAVLDLDLNIRSGEVYGLLGPNGSGKSTTLKMMLALIFPTRGRVTVFGKPPIDVQIKNRIGFLPEDSYLYPFLDAHETLDYYGRLFGQPRQERRRRIGMLLDMVGLTGAAYRRIGEYSKGMQRRIGMAQALINDPDLLILDEPTSGMDPLAARQFKDLITELSRRGKTVILSSHLLADMEDVCDRVGILYGGQLRSEGTLDDLLSRSNMTQIVSERLDEAAAAKVRRAFADIDKNVISMEAPRDKLEALFLRIVRDAQARHMTLETVQTGEVAEFLRAGPEDQARKVIDELLAKPERAQGDHADVQAAPPPSLEPVAGPDEGVIRQLTEPDRQSDPADTTEPTGPAESSKPPSQPREPRREDIDRSLIDTLTREEDTDNDSNA